jgi:trk system potassium uptake protein
MIRPKIADLVIMKKDDAELMDIKLENEKLICKKLVM